MSFGTNTHTRTDVRNARNYYGGRKLKIGVLQKGPCAYPLSTYGVGICGGTCANAYVLAIM